MNDRMVKAFYVFFDSCLSIIRLIVVTCFRKTIPFIANQKKCLIMCNGPSLIESLENNKHKISELDLVAVNFMAIYPEYIKYKPSIYILCDPVFWFEKTSEDISNKVKDFYSQIIEKTHWKLQLFMPYQASKYDEIRTTLSKNHKIELCFYNKTKFEGYNFLRYRIYNKQWGMPRAESVTIVGLMLAIYSGYKEIYIAGAESDFFKYIWVDKNNKLRLNDCYFYNNVELNDDSASFLKENVHEYFLSCYYIFNGYRNIENYAIYRKAKIYNTGLKSYIDAFEKCSLIK